MICKRIRGVPSALLLFLLGCTSVDHRSWTSVDSWYTPDHPIVSEIESGKGSRWIRLNPSCVSLVEPSVEGEAEHALADQAWRAITMGEMGRLIGRIQDVPAGKAAYLIRGVRLNCGSFQVYSNGSALFVDHGCIGSRAVAMRRQCLVIFLDQPPSKVFLSCSMVE